VLSLHHSVDALEVEVFSTSKSVDALENEIVSVSDSVDALENEITSVARSVGALESEILSVLGASTLLRRRRVRTSDRPRSDVRAGHESTVVLATVREEASFVSASAL
jgi:predicted  nucleic acid-binding Zn-ribbon protein